MCKLKCSCGLVHDGEAKAKLTDAERFTQWDVLKKTFTHTFFKGLI